VIERLLERMRDHGTMLNPTLWVFAESQRPDSVSALRTPWTYAVTKRAFELGIPIVAGTDGLFSRDSLPTIHRELELLVTKAGLTPLAAITSATLNGARAIGSTRRTERSRSARPRTCCSSTAIRRTTSGTRAEFASS